MEKIQPKCCNTKSLCISCVMFVKGYREKNIVKKWWGYKDILLKRVFFSWKKLNEYIYFKRNHEICHICFKLPLVPARIVDFHGEPLIELHQCDRCLDKITAYTVVRDEK